MKIIFTKKKLTKLIQNEKDLGFVPTMGTLHKGHISLINKCISQCKKTIVTIFINKSQFNKKEDFENYPRNLENDINMLKKINIDYLYLPTSKQIYPKGFSHKIKISPLGKRLCGKYRPKHFEGVADVIDRFIKLLNPNKIYFGKKDMQQLIIMREFIKRKYPKIKIIGCKTIRENNGIACSSRNFLLSTNEKKKASKIFKFIFKNKSHIYKKKISIKFIKNKIFELGANKIDYIEILNINRLMKPFKRKIKYKIFFAYYMGSTRLIDNI